MPVHDEAEGLVIHPLSAVTSVVRVVQVVSSHLANKTYKKQNKTEDKRKCATLGKVVGAE